MLDCMLFGVRKSWLSAVRIAATAMFVGEFMISKECIIYSLSCTACSVLFESYCMYVRLLGDQSSL